MIRSLEKGFNPEDAEAAKKEQTDTQYRIVGDMGANA